MTPPHDTTEPARPAVTGRLRRWTPVVFAWLCYAAFARSMIYLIAFLANTWVDQTVGASAVGRRALGVDALVVVEEPDLRIFGNLLVLGAIPVDVGEERVRFGGEVPLEPLEDLRQLDRLAVVYAVHAARRLSTGR